MTAGPHNPYSPPKSGIEDGNTRSGCSASFAWGAGAAALNYIFGALLLILHDDRLSTELDPEIGAVLVVFWLVLFGPFVSIFPAGVVATAHRHTELGPRGLALVAAVSIVISQSMVYLWIIQR